MTPGGMQMEWKLPEMQMSNCNEEENDMLIGVDGVHCRS